MKSEIIIYSFNYSTKFCYSYDNSGCHGGTLEGALKYVLKNGIPTEKDYGVYTEHVRIWNITNSWSKQKENN